MKIYSQIEFAEALGVSPETVKNWHKRGKLTRIPHDYFILYSQEELDRAKREIPIKTYNISPERLAKRNAKIQRSKLKGRKRYNGLTREQYIRDSGNEPVPHYFDNDPEPGELDREILELLGDKQASPDSNDIAIIRNPKHCSVMPDQSLANIACDYQPSEEHLTDLKRVMKPLGKLYVLLD